MFHALTGCDTVSFFAGRGKRTAWEVWTAVPELTQVFIDLTTSPDQVDEDATHIIETSDQTYQPLWTTLREASEVCRELVSCKCQKVCTKKCKCKKENLECTVYNYVHVTGSALRTELGTPKQSYITTLSISNSICILHPVDYRC